MQARQPSYKESVKQRRARLFSGEGKRYVVQLLCPKSDLPADQVILEPSMEVSYNSASLSVPLNRS